MTKGFLSFLEQHEKKLEKLLEEDVNQDTEEFMEDYSEPVQVPVKKVAPKPIQKIPLKPKVVVKESSTFSFCTKCGNKLPQGIQGKFCPFCGSATLMSTTGNNKVAVKKNDISENVSYASNLLDDEPMEKSRLLEYMEKNPVKNPMIEMIKGNQSSGESAMDRASELLDGTSETGQVQLLQMPDFSKFMPPKPKEEIKESVPNIPMAPSNLAIGDSSVENQMRSMGLL